MKKLLILLITLSLSMTTIGCGNSEDVVKSEVQDEVKDEIIDEVKVNYEVLEKKDISMANAKRYSWEVVIEEKINKEDLKQLAKQIIEDAKDEKPFNAITIWFYDYEEYIGSGYTLGKAEFAPEGDWSKADTVKAGDYKKMDYDFDLREKDWEKQLTTEEVVIYKAWYDLYEQKDTVSELPDEDEVNQEIANEFNTTEEEVDNILMKQSTWMFNNKE